MRILLLLILFASNPSGANAQQIDPVAGRYSIPAQPDAASEAARLDRMIWTDETPIGRFARKGDNITVTVTALPDGHQAQIVIGFHEMWAVTPPMQVVDLPSDGTVTFTADADGPIALRHVGAAGDLNVVVAGGAALPFFHHNVTTAADWQRDLADYAPAPFVQLLSDHALITLPRAVFDTAPMRNPDATLAKVEEMLALQDDLSGLDGSSPLHNRSPNRAQYLVDFLASPADRDLFYMYATNHFVGMLDYNASDLTDPDKLTISWGPWHETGHIQQQTSWTWENLVEVNTNIYALFVQEQFGQPNRLRVDEGDGVAYAKAAEYLAGDPIEYNSEDGDYFVKLVMLDQLRMAYGWDLYRQLNRSVRENPLSADALEQDKIDLFVTRICQISGHDLRGFFSDWGLTWSDKADAAISALTLPLPEVDPARLL